MPWQFSPFAPPLIAAAIVSAGVAAYGFRHRRTPGGYPLAAVGVCAAEWSLAFALYAMSTDAGVRLWLAKALHLGAGAIPVAWLTVAAVHTRWRGRAATAAFRVAVAAAGIPILLAWTNELHGLFFEEFRLAEVRGRVGTFVEYGPAFWVHMAVSWLILTGAVLVLGTQALRSGGRQRKRDVALLVAAVIPWLGNVVHFMRPGFFPANPMPFLFTASGLILGWAIVHLRLIPVIPVARAALVDGMRDGVLVVDVEGTVVDLNPSARRILELGAGRGVGEPVQDVLEPLSIPWSGDGGGAENTPRRVAVRGRIFQVTTSTVGERNAGSSGELIVLSDVTELEHAHRVRATELEAELANARLLALRMQLQPHFLFNALNSISCLVAEDARAAEQMIGYLAELLRSALATSAERDVPLRAELELLKRYFAIEQIRFGKRLRVELDCAPTTMDACVPTLLLQPLVENAVLHGIQPLAQGGTIRITSGREDGFLRLEIADTGVGPGPALERRAAVRVGLRNTRERLERRFGAGHEFTIGPNEPSGTRVVIRIPWITGAGGCLDAALPEARVHLHADRP